MPTRAREALLAISLVVVIAAIGAAGLTSVNHSNEKPNFIRPAGPLSRAKRTVGCFDRTSSNGNLCYNAQCPYYSMGACRDGLCACVPKGKNMATIREVCYESCYASCTHSCFGDDTVKGSPKWPCDTQCTKLCHED